MRELARPRTRCPAGLRHQRADETLAVELQGVDRPEGQRWRWRAPLAGDAASQRCSAPSTRTGQPCGRFAIKGGTVCATYGGSGPQARAAAKRRLEGLALDTLADVMKNSKNDAESGPSI